MITTTSDPRIRCSIRSHSREMAFAVALLAQGWSLDVSVVSRAAPPNFARAKPAIACGAPPSATDALRDVLRAGGLDESQVEEVWERKPPGKLPGATSQAALLSWLQTTLAGEPVRFSYLCLRKAPGLMLRAGPNALPQLQASMEALRELAAFQQTPSQFSFRVAHAPDLLLVPEQDLRDRATWLADFLDLNREQLGGMLAATPQLLTARREAIEGNVAWLQQLLSDQGRMAKENEPGRLKRVVCAAPLCLLAKEKTLEARASYLRDLGAEGELLASLVLCTPTLLHTPLGSLDAKLGWWREAGVADDAEMLTLLGRSPRVLDVAPSRCDAARQWLEGLGMSRAEALSVLRHEPAVLEQKEDQLQLRASFFCDVIGGEASELATVPHMLTCNLARHAMLRHAFCLAKGIAVAPTDLLVKGTARFCAEVADCDEEELNEFEADGKHLQFYAGATL